MSKAIFEIGADGVDADAIMASIEEAVEAKRAAGLYADTRIARAELENLSNLKDEKEFLRFYMDCLRQSAFVDINDFEISERRRLLSAPLVFVKRCIWNMLKFYTYRLWSQQNQVNGLLLTALENIDGHYRDRIETLERRIDELEDHDSSATES